MMIEFGNGFKAELINNEWEGTKLARLYTPDDQYLTGAYCTEDTFQAVSEALMNGYFSGWNQCKAAIKSAVVKAVDVNIDYSSYTIKNKK